MIVHRVTSHEWKSVPHLVNGVGAGSTGGRWNPSGTNTLYVSLEDLVAFAEKGYYSVITVARELNAAYASLPKGASRDLLALEYVLSSIEIRIDPSEILDISDPEQLLALAGKIGHPITFDQAVADLYHLDAATQSFGAALHSHGAKGFFAQSARRLGKNLVIFPDRLDISKDVRVLSQHEIQFSGMPEGLWRPYDVDKDDRFALDRLIVRRRVGSKMEEYRIRIGRK